MSATGPRSDARRARCAPAPAPSRSSPRTPRRELVDLRPSRRLQRAALRHVLGQSSAAFASSTNAIAQVVRMVVEPRAAAGDALLLRLDRLVDRGARRVCALSPAARRSAALRAAIALARCSLTASALAASSSPARRLLRGHGAAFCIGAISASAGSASASSSSTKPLPTSTRLAPGVLHTPRSSRFVPSSARRTWALRARSRRCPQLAERRARPRIDRFSLRSARPESVVARRRVGHAASAPQREHARRALARRRTILPSPHTATPVVPVARRASESHVLG